MAQIKSFGSHNCVGLAQNGQGERVLHQQNYISCFPLIHWKVIKKKQGEILRIHMKVQLLGLAVSLVKLSLSRESLLIVCTQFTVSQFQALHRFKQRNPCLEYINLVSGIFLHYEEKL